MPRDLKELHRLALERFKLTAHAEQKQRERELEDLRFADPIDPCDQWPKDALNSRAGLPAAGTLPAVPARPALTINKLRQPLQQVQNQQRQARLSLEFSPEGDGASQDDADAFEDIARAVQADSRAHLARNWAFDRAIKCGRGFYRIETDYVTPRSFDQKIIYKRILNQFSVYFYPFCQEPDFSDAEWCFVTEDVPWPIYQRRYKGSALADYDDEALTALGDECPGWVSENDEGKTVRIAEYYFFETVADVLLNIRTPAGERSVLQSELPKGTDAQILDQRPVEVRQLRWAKLNGCEFLKDPGLAETIVERDGQYIPIVPVIADESNINGERRYTGIVRPAIDAQRLFNVEASALAEAVHLGPIAPFIGYANQFEGLESWWGQLNTRRFPFLPVNPPRNANEAGLPVPQRNTAEQPIEALVASLQQADSYIHATTLVPPAALGALDPHDRSGKAIAELKQQSDLATSGYIDNLTNMSLLLEGKILRDLIPHIYDRPGRTVSAQGDDDERKSIILNSPFIQKRGQPPQQVQPGTPNAQIIDLAKGEYTVAPTVGKSFSTKREEAVSQLGELASAVPDLVPAFADIWVKNMDGPGFRQIADRLAKAVPPQFKDDDGQADPQALQQQLAHQGQIMQALTAHVNDLSEQIKTKQLERQTELDKADKDNATKIEIARINQAGAFAVADLKAGLEAANQAIAAMQEERKAFEMVAGHIHAAGEQGRDHAHEVRMAIMGHAQALQQGEEAHAQQLEQGVQDHAAALAQGEQGQAHALEQGQQAADLAPEPMEGASA